MEWKLRGVQWTRPLLAIGAAILLASMPLLSCAGKRPSHLGVSDAGLAPCPSSPNCVSSDARDGSHRVEPLRLAVAPAEAWRSVRKAVSELPRSRIVKETPDYLHVECRSALFGFVDDLELQLRPTEEIVAVRSASRLGHSDLGVNRRRVEGLRASLTRRGVLR
jgi:uncharacterized protein (DUF1499 family)